MARAKLAAFAAKKPAAGKVTSKTAPTKADPSVTKAMTIRLNLDAWRQLRFMAFDDGRTAHALLIDALNAYFKKQGLPIPILSHGFGETSLLVSTPDQTDEPRNRRVEYIIAVEPPRAVGWTRVR